MASELEDPLRAARLEGRGYVVLGAGGGGIGEAVAHIFAAAGADLICVDRDEKEAQAIAAATGGTAHAADVTSRAELTDVFERTEALFGTRFAGVIDIVGMASMGGIASFDDAAIARQFDIVFGHALRTVQLAAPLLARTGGGSIGFVGSVSGIAAIPNQPVYGMAKAALHHLVRYAGQEFGPQGVRVNAVAPGFVETPRLKAALPAALWAEVARTNPLRRPAQPRDVANALLFLASDLAAYVNGAILPLDGGVTNNAAMPGIEGAPPWQR
jgi:NAD(P)-dependent dehydrogenase (short-subunit alcohol dehydrogenase family)